MGIFTQACGGKDDNPTPTTKTLDKAKLVGKKWYPKGSVDNLDIKANGVFGSDGTWKWINNSDTMEILPSVGLKIEKWKFYWSADHEMACNLAGDPGEILYKDAAW